MAVSGQSREQLIGALATAMGAGSFAQTKYEGAHFDHDTGTLYCNGIVISKSSIQDALEYFQASKVNCEKMAEQNGDISMRNIAIYMQTAIEAIKLMQHKEIVPKKGMTGR